MEEERVVSIRRREDLMEVRAEVKVVESAEGGGEGEKVAA